MSPRLAHHTSHLHGGKKKINSFRVGLILKILLPVLLKLRKTGRNGGSGKNMVNIFLRCRSSKHSTEVRLSEEVLWYRVESEWVFCTESSENWRAGCSASAQLISVSELDLLWLSQSEGRRGSIPLHVEVYLGKFLNPKRLLMCCSADCKAVTAVSVCITVSHFGQKLLLNVNLVALFN